MKLQGTKLCVNCESIYEGPGPCPTCSSETFIWLYAALGTTLDSEARSVRTGLKGDFKPRRHEVVPTLN